MFLFPHFHQGVFILWEVLGGISELCWLYSWIKEVLGQQIESFDLLLGKYHYNCWPFLSRNSVPFKHMPMQTITIVFSESHSFIIFLVNILMYTYRFSENNWKILLLKSVPIIILQLFKN